MDYSKNMLFNQEILQESCVFKGKTNTWLHIQFDEDISEELGNSLPYPHYHYLRNNKLVYCWLIDGYFDTIDGYNYLNDIIARVQITFNNSKYLNHSKEDETKINPIKLRQFQNLKSRAIQKIYNNMKYDSTKDFIFYSLKLHAEMIIKEKGIFSYSELEQFSFDNFIDKAKDRSTLKAKCRNIFNWYLERNFKLTQSKYTKKDKGEVMATRLEHIKKVNEDRKAETERKILNCITGLMQELYKKPNGSWSIAKISKDTNLHRNTISNFLKNYNETN